MLYIKPLDTVRAFAAFLVLLSHLLPPGIIASWDAGTVGVGIFFALSGFLITRILLNLRDNENPHPFLTFYKRRALRIWPLYYFVVIVFLIFLPVSIAFGDALPFVLTYTLNYHFWITGHFDGFVFHFWTLAVEEQFYLLWPLVIIFCPRKALLPVISSFVLLGLLSRHITIGSFNLGIVFDAFDALAMGGLIAWCFTVENQLTTLVKRLAPVGFIISLLVLLTGYWVYTFLPRRTEAAITTAFLIMLLVQWSSKPETFVYRLFCNRIFLYLGRISYGLYVYHVPISGIADSYLRKFNLIYLASLNLKFDPYLIFAEEFAVTVVIASLSWYVLEKPFLRLKDRPIFRRITMPVS